MYARVPERLTSFANRPVPQPSSITGRSGRSERAASYTGRADDSSSGAIAREPGRTASYQSAVALVTRKHQPVHSALVVRALNRLGQRPALWRLGWGQPVMTVPQDYKMAGQGSPGVDELGALVELTRPGVERHDVPPKLLLHRRLCVGINVSLHKLPATGIHI